MLFTLFLPAAVFEFRYGLEPINRLKDCVVRQAPVAQSHSPGLSNSFARNLMAGYNLTSPEEIFFLLFGEIGFTSRSWFLCRNRQVGSKQVAASTR